ncbi:MAG TPA: hypothetical protein VGI98_00085 [Candidatus Limnocylindrales bacterium]
MDRRPRIGLLETPIARLAFIRPELLAALAGLFLFVQSALERLTFLPGPIERLISSSDEGVLVVLLAWVAARAWWRSERLRLPAVLWPLAVMLLVALAGTILNRVPPDQAALGTFLALKAPLWLVVGANLEVSPRDLRRYATLIGALFAAAAIIGVVQLLGLDLPWTTHLRRSGDIAATSIFNQHTVFGSAMAVGVGLAVAGLLDPPSRRRAVVLLAATVIGGLISTTRRLLVSLPLSALALIRSLRLPIVTPARVARGRAVLSRRSAQILLALAVVASVGIAAVVVAPRVVHLVGATWDEYVINASTRDRYELYGGAFRLVADSPVVGRGPGTYGSWASVVYKSPVFGQVGVHLKVGLRTGAPYASLLAEFGLLGAAAFMAFVALLYRALIRVARRTGELAAAIAGGAAFMVVDMVIESVVHVSFVDSFAAFFVFVGAGLALGAMAQSQAAAPSSPAGIDSPSSPASDGATSAS